MSDSYGIAPPGYRLPAATRPGTLHLQVASLDRSLPYYTGVLGCTVLQRAGDVAWLGVAGADEPLLALHEHPGAAPVPPQGRLGLYHFAILLPERAALAAFVRHLSAVSIHAGMSDHLVSEAVYLTDPDGLGIEVYADRPREQWQVRDGELRMITAPLDVRDLLRASPPVPWSGLPPRTCVGHIHLFVDDLEHAAAFYHAALGFDQAVWSYPGALFLAAGGYHHHLGTNTWAADAPPAGPDDARLLEWSLVLDRPEDVAAAAASLQAAGYPVTPEGDAVTAADPWGTRVRLLAAAPQG